MQIVLVLFENVFGYLRFVLPHHCSGDESIKIDICPDEMLPVWPVDSKTLTAVEFF